MAFKLVRAASGDRWDSIAYRERNDALNYQDIIEQNLEYSTVVSFLGGELIRVPELPITSRNTTAGLPPWKRL
jgi:hypothetical protein